MIGFSWDFCGNFNVLQHTLTDIRDSKTYQVKKLADGNIWMTQNLALVGPFYPDQSDSDVTWTKVTSGDNQTFQLTASDDSTWCSDLDAACIDQSKVLYSGNADYGTYYNWFAATAGTGTYELISGDAQSSICPKSWRLPTGGTNKEFHRLIEQYNLTALTQGAPNVKLPGSRAGDTISNPGTTAGYWSSRASKEGYSAYLWINQNQMAHSSDWFARYRGFTVRCVAK